MPILIVPALRIDSGSLAFRSASALTEVVENALLALEL